jgi:hypothetical protein
MCLASGGVAKSRIPEEMVATGQKRYHAADLSDIFRAAATDLIVVVYTSL